MLWPPRLDLNRTQIPASLQESTESSPEEPELVCIGRITAYEAKMDVYSPDRTCRSRRFTPGTLPYEKRHGFAVVAWVGAYSKDVDLINFFNASAKTCLLAVKSLTFTGPFSTSAEPSGGN